MLGCPPRWGTLESQMVHFSAIAMIHRRKVVPFSDIIRGTFALTNIIGRKKRDPEKESLNKEIEHLKGIIVSQAGEIELLKKKTRSDW